MRPHVTRCRGGGGGSPEWWASSKPPKNMWSEDRVHPVARSPSLFASLQDAETALKATQSEAWALQPSLSLPPCRIRRLP